MWFSEKRMHGVYPRDSVPRSAPRGKDPRGTRGSGRSSPRATHPGKVDRLPKMLPVPGKSYPGDDAGREWRLRDGNRSGVSRHPRKVGVTRVTPGAFKMKLKR